MRSSKKLKEIGNYILVQIRNNSDLIEALAVLASLASSYESLAFDDLAATLPENAFIQ